MALFIYLKNIASRAHAVPLPCRTAKGLEWSFPFYLHSAAVSDSHFPCRAHAIPDHAVLLKATAQYGRRETACRLLTRVRLHPAITQSSTKLSNAYQTKRQVASVKPNTVYHGREEW